MNINNDATKVVQPDERTLRAREQAFAYLGQVLDDKPVVFHEQLIKVMTPAFRKNLRETDDTEFALIDLKIRP